MKRSEFLERSDGLGLRRATGELFADAIGLTDEETPVAKSTDLTAIEALQQEINGWVQKYYAANEYAEELQGKIAERDKDLADVKTKADRAAVFEIDNIDLRARNKKLKAWVTELEAREIEQTNKAFKAGWENCLEEQRERWQRYGAESFLGKLPK